MKHITLVGFGLLASSIASAIRQSNLPITIRAVSSNSTLKEVRELDLAQEFFEYTEIEHWSKNTDLILLCGPILHIMNTMENLKNVSWAKENGNVNNSILISDIGSTKVEICKIASTLPATFKFVGGHPMAGSEKRGCANNDPSIFENAYWFVCPSGGDTEESYKPLITLIHFLGANPVVFSPEHHDLTMAWVSHMPQMLSSTLAANLPKRLLSNNYQHYAGRAFRDMTRIAASSWEMWHDIAITNQKETLTALEEIQTGLSKTIEAFKTIKSPSKFSSKNESSHESDGSKLLEKIFIAGNEGRASLFTPGRNSASAFFEITIQLKDEPGALLQVLTPLAKASINIRDIELMRVRENIAGTLLLAFKTAEEAKNALNLLKGLNYDAKER